MLGTEEGDAHARPEEATGVEAERGGAGLAEQPEVFFQEHGVGHDTWWVRHPETGLRFAAQ